MAVTGQEIISRDPEIMSGSAVFRGTRVLIQTPFDYLAGGDPLERFFEEFPTVPQYMAEEILDKGYSALLTHSAYLESPPTFDGTQILIETFFDRLKAGESIDDFTAIYPNVSRESAVAVIKLAKSVLASTFDAE